MGACSPFHTLYQYDGSYEHIDTYSINLGRGRPSTNSSRFSDTTGHRQTRVSNRGVRYTHGVAARGIASSSEQIASRQCHYSLASSPSSSSCCYYKAVPRSRFALISAVYGSKARSIFLL